MADMANTSTIYPSNVTTYNYTAIIPSDGNCEFKEIGSVGPIKEFGNMIFSIGTALAGLVGIILSRNINISSRYLYSLVFGYGFMSALYSATLWNGFSKTTDCLLNLYQAITIVCLASSLKFKPFSNTAAHPVANMIVIFFGYYPIASITWASSNENPWIGWLSYDLIWAIILPLVIIIFANRRKYACYETTPQIFSSIWLAMGSIILAYVFWLLDRFACSFGVAVIYPLGWWYLLNGFGFYYLTTLNACLQAGFSGYTTSAVFWPNKCMYIFIFVRWEKNGNNEEALDPEESELQPLGGGS